MASINESANTGRRRAGVRKRRNIIPRVDMTPMVDLGFLLITFFVMTATMSEPHTTQLLMPKDGGADTPVGESVSLSLLIGENAAWYYEGNFEEALAAGSVHKTGLHIRDGLGSVIREKQGRLGVRKPDLVYMIKSGPGASYGQVVDALDEASINQIQHYSLVKISEAEQEFLDRP